MTSKFAPGWILTTCVALALAVLLWLGFWQLDRLEEKTAFLAQIDASIDGEPEPFPDYVKNPEEWEYRKVNISAKAFEDNRLICIFGRNNSGEMGLFQLIPISLKGSQHMLVNMGWKKVKDLANISCESGIRFGDSKTVILTGIIRSQTKDSAFTPNADVENRVWYKLDIASKAQVMDIENLLPLMLDNVSVDGGMLRETYMPLSIPNDHLQYALTWFGVAIMLIGVYVAFGLQRARK